MYNGELVIFQVNPLKVITFLLGVKNKKRYKMKHELKVILGETTSDTHVLVDNQPIGLIQELKMSVAVGNPAPQIEIVFPNLEPFTQTNKELVDTFHKQIALLKELPQVKVTLQDLNFEKH